MQAITQLNYAIRRPICKTQMNTTKAPCQLYLYLMFCLYCDLWRCIRIR